VLERRKKGEVCWKAEALVLRSRAEARREV
jgi:hypothetical protein